MTPFRRTVAFPFIIILCLSRTCDVRIVPLATIWVGTAESFYELFRIGLIYNIPRPTITLAIEENGVIDITSVINGKFTIYVNNTSVNGAKVIAIN